MFAPIFVPAEQAAEIICEVDMEQIFRDIEQIPDDATVSLKTYEFEGKSYTVNLAGIRYRLLSKNRRCACCGIIGTKMYLGRFEEADNQGYNFRLFAETKEQNYNKPTHLVLMTRDHIVPDSKGGKNSLENSQCLCVLCNFIKGETELEVSKIKQILFPAYRVFRGTYCLNNTQEKLKPWRLRLKGYVQAVKNIDLGLKKVSNPATFAKMEMKKALVQQKITLYEQKIQEVEICSQTKGKVYCEQDFQDMFKKIDELDSQI